MNKRKPKIKAIVFIGRFFKSIIKNLPAVVFKPVFKITGRRIMKYISTFTMLVMVFGVILWSMDFDSVSASATIIFTDDFDQGSGDDFTNGWKTSSGADNPDDSGSGSDARETTSDNGWTGVDVSDRGLLLEGASSGNPDEGAERDIATMGYSSLTIKYSRAINGFEDGDQFRAEYSLDGSLPVALETLVSDQAHSLSVEFAVPNPDRHTKLTLRFYVNGNEDDDEAAVDNIIITGDNAPNFYDGFEAGDFSAGLASDWTVFDGDDESGTNLPTIAHDDGGDDIMWTDDNSTAAGHSTSSHATDGHGVNIEGNGDASPDEAIERSFDATGLQNIYLRYSRRANNLEISDEDEFRIRYSTNGGFDWTTLESVFDDTIYDSIKFGPLSGADNNAALKFRFEMNGDHINDDIYIDDVVIWGEPLTTITVVKNSIPEDGQDFSFTTAGSGLSTFTLDDDSDPVLSNTKVFSGLGAGTYSIAENAVEGWAQTNAVCSDGSPVSAIVLGAGENITCTFTNTKRGHIIVDKVTVGGDATFSFNADGGANPVYNDFDLAGGDDPNDQELKPGTYSVSEDSLSGWDLTSVICSDGSDYSSISLQAGETVTCTFTNTKLASFSLEKIADPEEGSFDFTLSGPYGFSENTALGPEADEDEWELDNLTPGEYTLTETLPESWLGGAQTLLCNSSEEGGDINQDISQTGSLAAFGLSAGEILSCTLNNTEDALISGIKFEDFDGTGDFTIGTGLEGWTVTAMEVIDDENEGESRSFSDTTDGDGNYSIQVPAGTWRVCEMQENGTWYQSYPTTDIENSILCDDGRGYEVTVETGGGETGLDFGNYRNGSILGFKWEDFNADGEYNEDDEELIGERTIFLDLNNNSTLDEGEPYRETDEDGLYSFENLAPETYIVRETNEEGWLQIFPGADADYKHSVTVESGEEEQGWNFGNFELVTIRGFKWDDQNGDGVWQKGDEESQNEPGLQDVNIALGRVNGESRQENEHEIIPIEIIALSLTSSDGGFQIHNVAPGRYKLFEESRGGWQATNPAPRADSFFDITYDVESAILDNPNFDLLRSSFFDIFVEFSGREVDQSEAVHTALTTVPGLPLEFGNHRLSVISREDTAGVGETSITIRWITDRPATSRVVYDTVSHPVLGSGLCPSPFDTLECHGYAFSTPESDLDLKVVEHDVTISGLTAGTTYYFRSISRASPESVGSEGSFSTQSQSFSNGGGGGGAPGSTILNGPGVASALTSVPTSSVPAVSSVPSDNSLNGSVAGASTSEAGSTSPESTGEESAVENVILDQADKFLPEETPPSLSENSEISSGGGINDGNSYAALTDSLGSVGWRWYATLLLVVVAGIYFSRKRN